MYETLNDYMENPNMDPSQLNDLLVMAKDYQNQEPSLFCKTFTRETNVNDLPF